MIKYILKLFGYKIMSIRDHENEKKVSNALDKEYKRKLRILAFNPNSTEAIDIRSLLTWELNHEHMVWYGEPPTDDQMKGILNQIPKG